MVQSDVIDTLADLIRIQSINPAYRNGSPESEIQRFVLNFFRSRGIEAWEQEVLPDRPNVIARLAGRDPCRRIVFEAHSDTVGVEGMIVPPFEPAVNNGRMYGRGACDTKAGLAAMMHALANLKSSRFLPPCEIWVVAAVDEEYSYRGAAKLCETLNASAAVISEPTGMRMAIASKGCLRWRITVRGRAAHSSTPNLGTNAIDHMARVLDSLAEDGVRLQAIQHHLLGSPTLNVGRIQGGTQVNVVPESCWIEVDRRLVPGEEPAEVFRRYEQMLGCLRDAEPELDVVMDSPMLQDWPLETPPDSPIVLQASGVLREVALDPQPLGVPFCSDASKLSLAGIPSIILGPGNIAQAHTEDEFVELDQVNKAFEAYRRLMQTFA